MTDAKNEADSGASRSDAVLVMTDREGFEALMPHAAPLWNGKAYRATAIQNEWLVWKAACVWCRAQMANG
jgi:hypothetical protein